MRPLFQNLIKPFHRFRLRQIFNFTPNLDFVLGRILTSEQLQFDMSDEALGNVLRAEDSLVEKLKAGLKRSTPVLPISDVNLFGLKYLG